MRIRWNSNTANDVIGEIKSADHVCKACIDILSAIELVEEGSDGTRFLNDVTVELKKVITQCKHQKEEIEQMITAVDKANECFSEAEEYLLNWFVTMTTEDGNILLDESFQ